MTDRQPNLIVVNQTVNPAFNGWLRRLAQTCGPIELWSGYAPGEIGPDVTVRSAAVYHRSSVMSRLRTWSAFAMLVTWQLLRRGDRTPLFVVTNPPLMPLMAWLLHKIQRRPYGILEWDIYPQVLAPLGLARPGHPLYDLWHNLHGRALRAASVIVTIGEQMAARLRETAADPELLVTVIPNWIDTEWIKPCPPDANPFVRKHGLQEKLVILYSGNLGTTHAVETIVDVAQQLRDEKHIRFLIIGEGSKRPLVETAIRNGRLPNTDLLPRQPASALPFTLTSAQFAFVTLGRGYEGLSMPSKTYALLAAGNALVGISEPPNDLASTIARHDCGANFPPDSPVAIARWLKVVAADRAYLGRMRSAARQAAVQHFSAENCEVRLTTAVSQKLLN